jgi:hypothetical protein
MCTNGFQSFCIVFSYAVEVEAFYLLLQNSNSRPYSKFTLSDYFDDFRHLTSLD